ncbi:MAG: murein L,D-transpeptidase family protein [Vitreoscilla sp.]
MTMEDDAPLASTPASRRPRWPGAAAAVGSLAVAGIGLLASTELHGIPSPHATAQAARAAVGASIVLADDAPPPSRRVAPAGPASASTLPPGSPFIGAFKGSPESRLIGIYRAIGQQQTELAIDAAAALTHDVPGFRLAQLVYADLLSARSGNLAGPGAAGSASAADPAVAAELGDLRDEAQQRLHALQERPPANQVPAEFIVLPKAIHHAIAVDTSRSRLYLFENGPQGVRLVSDHYVSVGKQGVDKSVEGDQRTPLGVYFVSDRVGQGSLGEAFGAGAMQLNYPNLLDKLHGRTGSGIYLHGVPFNTYSRPPKDSDGCVTLANDELVALMNTVPIHDTPVIITRQIHWVSDSAAQLHRAEILDAVNHWQSVRAGDDPQALKTFYEPGAAPETPAAPPLPPPAVVMVHGKRRVLPPPAVPPKDPISFDNLSVMTWSDAKETMVVTFNERSTRTHRETALRQYWERDAARWKIVAEGTVR